MASTSKREEVITNNLTERTRLVKRGRYLEYFTIGYNSLEGLIAVGAGVVAGSIALVGFGFDSLIEVTSGAVLLWRLHADVDEERRGYLRVDRLEGRNTHRDFLRKRCPFTIEIARTSGMK